MATRTARSRLLGGPYLMTTFGTRHHDAMATPLCDRCGRSTRMWRTSLSNDAAICRACSLIESARPDSPGAWTADAASGRVVDYSYPGAGASPDLIGR
jgi:hypothetical protein